MRRIEPFAPSGALLLAGGGSLPDEAKQGFVELAGGEKARIVVIPTASGTVEMQDSEFWLEPWRSFDVESLQVVHTRDRTQADSSEFCRALQQATGIWMVGGSQSRLADAYGGTRALSIIESLLFRGGVVGGTSAGAAIASRRMIAGGRTIPRLGTGFDLLPHAIVDQHFTQRNRQQRLRKAVATHPDCVGIGIDEGTYVLFRGRTMSVHGRGSAHIVMSATESYAASEQVLEPEQLADWTSLVRWNAARKQPVFPDPARPLKVAFPPTGSLMIAGGGRLPEEVLRRFVELAGDEAADIVVLPTASDPPQQRPGIARAFEQAGARSVTVLPQTALIELTSTAYLNQLRSATGIWFGGGRQWRFVDHYEATPVVEEFRKCLQRGGVIGGSSAGASIQGELLIRGAPIGNHVMVQDGYRHGFEFIGGVGIDQHFSQRNRMADLLRTVANFPTILGLGIDEGTALCVSGGLAEVLGEGKVHVLQAALTTRQSGSFEGNATVLHREFGPGSKLTVDELQEAD